MKTADELISTIDDLTLSAWTLAAIATLFESGLADALTERRTIDELAARVTLPRERIARLLDVVTARGLVTATGERYTLAPGVVPFTKPPMRDPFLGKLRSITMQPLAYVTAAARGTMARGWGHTDPILLQAQGEMSAGFADALADHIVHQLGDLRERLAKPTARFLDVGVGVAAQTIAICRLFPQLRAVGLDVFDVPLGMARDNVARAGLADRIELRQLAIEDLRDAETYDLIWLPMCFLSPPVVPAAVARAHAALRPGGWILSPSLSTDADEANRLIYSMMLESWGTVTDSAFVSKAFTDVGFVQPRRLGSSGSTMALIVAQR